jgi:nucleoside-diphosphate-sugar epimerase
VRIVVTGASGNVGTAVVEALVAQPEVEQVVGVCRRPHTWLQDEVSWHWADVAHDDLTPILRQADAVIHLAWLFHPMRDPTVTWRANVEGSLRVFSGAVEAGVGTLVHASSVGAYSPRVGVDPVDESWPTNGVPQVAYSREKAYLERALDALELQHRQLHVVRMRPAFIFRREAAEQQRRLFLGPFASRRLLRPGRVPILPMPEGLRFQAVHSRDVADAYVRAAVDGVRGSFNLAAEPVLDPDELARILRCRWRPVPAHALRLGIWGGFRSRVLPVPPELFDLLMSVPVMSTQQAHEVLGWQTRTSADDALRSFLEAPTTIHDPATPPLASETSGPLRLHELRGGLGVRA